MMEYLKFNSQKTHDLCLEAVRKDGFALKYVPEEYKDLNLCLTALHNDPNAIEWVPEKFNSLIEKL